jgi:hypothetical protein
LGLDRTTALFSLEGSGSKLVSADNFGSYS